MEQTDYQTSRCGFGVNVK